MKQNPFSLYDFLGYLIPGSTVIYLFLIIENWTSVNGKNSIEGIFSSVSKYDFQEIFFFIIISYSLGHLISFISSITVEKYGNWKYGYPSKTIIGYTKESYWIKKSLPEGSKETKLLYEVEKNNNKDRKLSNVGRGLLLILLIPLVLIEFLFGTLLNFKNFYSKGLDVALTDIIKENVLLLLNSKKLSNSKVFIESDLKDIDFNRIVHHYVFENSRKHQFRLVNYVALYGFLRNLVLAFVLSSWYYLIISLKTINTAYYINWSMIGLNLLLMGLSFVSFMAYMKFYRRYTLEGLMLLVVDKTIEEQH
ncbi:hypothetical protein [Maribacter thermophilus]|uniref:hypothetical protein n=1 Tax=Maribacter thermophilus TaxID=1197874 RepID=UPI0006412C31|nr:hypothetical protein [Maribacter thermophilus]